VLPRDGGAWDNCISGQGVGTDPPGRPLGAAIWRVPPEEYAFMVLPVDLASLMLPAVTGRPAAPCRR
jgi:hypothetical protein